MRRNRFVAVGLSLTAAALCSLLIAGSAASEDLQAELEAKQSKLTEVEEKKGVLTSTISRFRDQIERLTDEVAAIRTREAAVEARLAAKQAELDRAVAELDTAKERLEQLRARLKRALIALRERLIAMYETGSPDMLSVIVGADGVDDLAARAEYIDRLHGMDEAVVGRVRDLRDQVQSLVTRLRNAKNTIEAARDAIAAEEQALASTRASLQSHQSQLVDTRRQREAALDSIGVHEEHLHDEVAEIQGEIAATLAATGSAPLPAGPIISGGGGLIWPVNGAVVSGFGPRWGSMHEGVDIAVPEMTPIRAAASGSVVILQSDAESGGYGNFTCLDHGGGLSTCYAHQTSFAVGAGQSVSQGDIIGYTGCTGHCLGPHLHFEVRINGSPTDPMGYL
ncbi:MAG TPA: peptidoglycan DD-metalloendopeptidase family protein [Solirubrobacterales bacterium]|nr:peptidoglycan DD-metalloendopeptidase family protein [Solirubrobacterales bacterium]